MITVKLFGALKSVCNNTSELLLENCRTLRSVFSALQVNFPKVHNYASTHRDNKMYLTVNGRSLNEDEVQKWVLFNGDIIEICPVVSGSGQEVLGYILIIVGILLIVFGVGEYFIMAGLAMIGSGLSMVMSPSLVRQPTSYEGLDGNSKESYGFNGTPANLTSQGNAVPVGYGRIRTGSQVISSGLRAVSL